MVVQLLLADLDLGPAIIGSSPSTDESRSMEVEICMYYKFSHC